MYTDILLFILVFLFAGLGFAQGFTAQLISLITWIALIFFSEPLALWIQSVSNWNWVIDTPPLLFWAFTGIAIVLLGSSLRTIFSISKKSKILSPLDHWLGFGMGFSKGILLAMLIGISIQVFPETTRDSSLNADLEKSRLVHASIFVSERSNFLSLRSLFSLRDSLIHDSSSRNLEEDSPWKRSFEVDPH